MRRKILGSIALFAALVTLFCLPAAAQKPQVYKGLAQAGALPVGTEEPCISNQCLFYSGDFDAAGQNPNGLWNNTSELFGITGTVYAAFTVPKKFKGAKGKTDWDVQGLFTNEQMFTPVAVTVNWAIVQGVAQGGNPGQGVVKTICSGMGTPSVTATGRVAFGLPEQTILLTGTSCPTLEAGEYWLAYVPTVVDLAYLSDVEDNTPANAEGPGVPVIDDHFFYSPDFGFSSFANTAGSTGVCGGIGCDNFSFGVIGAAVH